MQECRSRVSAPRHAPLLRMGLTCRIERRISRTDVRSLSTVKQAARVPLLLERSQAAQRRETASMPLGPLLLTEFDVPEPRYLHD